MNDADRPHCPFCGAPWSEGMLARLDAATHPSSCRCCGVEPVAFTPLAAPAEDILCDACRRPIYRAVAPAA